MGTDSRTTQNRAQTLQIFRQTQTKSLKLQCEHFTLFLN